MSKEKKNNITYAEPSNYFPKHIRDEVEREEAERRAAEKDKKKLNSLHENNDSK